MSNSINKYHVFIFLLVVNTLVSAGPNYEAQVNHSIGKWESELNLLSKTTSLVGIEYLCMSENSANEFVAGTKPYKYEIEKGKWLSYTYKVSIVSELPDKSNAYNKWLRLQFFKGVAYYCDMDALKQIENKNL